MDAGRNAKGDGEEQTFFVGVEEKEGGDKFRKLVSIGGRDWTLVTISADELEYQEGGDGRLDWDKVNSINISPEIDRAGHVTIDDFTLGAYEPSLTNGFSPDVFADWGLWAGEGSRIESSETDGASGKGIRFDYERSAAGWGLVAHGSLPADWNPEGTRELRFQIRGDGTDRRYSVGVEEKDGGDKFRRIIEVSGTDWTPVTIAAEELNYQDGGGDRKLDWNLVNGINISPEENGAGCWMLDEFSFYKGGLLPPIVKEPALKLTGLAAQAPGSAFAGKAVSLQAKVTNAGTEPAAARQLNYTVTDAEGTDTLSGTADVPALPAGGEAAVELAFEAPRYGFYTVRASVESEGGAESAAATSFAAVAPLSGVEDGRGPDQDPDTLVGFSTHYDFLGSDALREQEAELIRLSGAKLVRNDFLWDKIEPRKGEYDWSLYDDIVAANEENGLNLIGLLAYSATWASSGPEGAEMREHYPPRTVSEYADFVYRTVSRYKKSVHLWEIWNEPNLDGFFRPTQDAEAYVELLKAGYLAAKRADPMATVVMSGLSGTGGGYLDEMVQLGAADYTDAVVIHPYQAGNPEAGDSFVHDIASVRAKMPGKPVWLTEWGWRTDEQGAGNQALYTVKGYLLAHAMDVEKNALYSFNIATDTQFGLADSNAGGEVKPVYPAVAALNRALAGRSYAGDVPLGSDGVAALAFEGRGIDPVLALWSATPQTVKLAARRSLKVYDFYGNETTLEPANGEAAISVSERPVYVKGDLRSYVRQAVPRTETSSAGRGGGKPNRPDTAWLMKSPYYERGNAKLTRGFANAFSVEVYNYGSQTISGQLRLQGVPASWFASPSAATVAYEAKPYSSTTVTFSLKPPADAAIGAVTATAAETGRRPALAAKAFALEVVPRLAVQADKKAVRLTNTTASPISGTLELAEPEGWTLTAAGAGEFTVAPGETAAIPYALSPKTGTKAAGTLTLTGSVSADGETIPFRQALSAVTASAAAQAPVIDGQADAIWQSAPAAAASEAWQVSADYRDAWTPGDLSASVRLLWDASRLYVLAEVKDDKASQAQSGGGMWQGDSLQLAFDARNEGGSGYGAQVYELQIGKPDGAAPQIFKGMGFAKPGLMETGEIAVVRDEAAGATVYELSIPFSELEGFDGIAAGRAAGFSYLVNDSDGAGREGYIEWSSGVGGSKNASLFGTLWLN